MLSRIEEYLQNVASALPPVRSGDDLHVYVARILKSGRPTAGVIRRAFGLARRNAQARELARVLDSAEPSMIPFIRLIAQRVYQMVWRLMYTLHLIEHQWARDALDRANELRTLCEPQLLCRRPTLADLRSFLLTRGELSAFRESAVDTELFAVLRAFQPHNELTYQEEHPPISAKELGDLQAVPSGGSNRRR